MQQHIEAGRPTEIDSLNGALVREANALGIAVPFNEALVLMVKARESGMVERATGIEKDYVALESQAELEEKETKVSLLGVYTSNPDTNFAFC